MKKILVLFLLFISIFMVVGCIKEEPKKDKEKKINVETEKETYLKYVKELKKVTESSEDTPFTVEVLYDKIKEEVRYQVIIDSPTEDITDISALAIHNKQTDDVFPSVGIFDNKVDLKKEEKPSGVILVGYIPYEGEIDDFECEIKLLVSYKINDEVKKVYYVTKK